MLRSLHRNKIVNKKSYLLRYTCVLHQILAAVKPQVTAVEEKIHLIHRFAPIWQQHKFPHKYVLNTGSGPVASIKVSFFMCSLKLNLVFNVL